MSKTSFYNQFTDAIEELPDGPISDSDQDGVDWHVSNYDGVQKPLLTLRYLYPGSSATQVRTYETYAYDNGQRLTDTKYLYTLYGQGLSVPTYTLSKLNYNFKDQLIEKNIGYTGSSALQSIDYAYNLRGWLTDINNVTVYNAGTTSILTPSSTGTGGVQNLMISPFLKQTMTDLTAPYKQANAMELSPINDNNADLFSEKISYNTVDSRFGVPYQSNGNISAVTWQVLGRTKQGYSFKYDDLDRLTESNYFDITESPSSGALNSTFSTDNKFKELAQYDFRGNITSLHRNGYKLDAGWTSNSYVAGNYGTIDSLAYTYGDSNRLKKVTDGSLPTKGFIYGNSGDARDYSYDANGNLTADRNKGIIKIEYNYLNLPQVITFTNKRTITFLYDAAGAKLRKITNKNDTITTYDYLNGVEYTNNMLQRIAHTEGSVSLQGDGSYQHEYVLRDHLGNTRVTFTDANNDGVVGVSDIKQINNLYPFGLNQEGNWNGAAGTNKYVFNGKEWNDDFGLGWNHHDWRFLDVATNRFVTIDRKAEEEGQEELSPYHFAHDNPIRYDDPDGQCPTCVTALAGGIIAATLDIAFQVGTNMSQGQDLSTAVSNINKTSVVISALAGAATSGVSAMEMIAGKGISAGTKVLATSGIDAMESIAKQVNDGKPISLTKTASDVAANYIAGEITAKSGSVINTKTLERNAERTSKISVNDPSSSGRATNALNAKSELNRAELKNHANGKAASGAVGNSLQLASDTYRTVPTNTSITKSLQLTPARDATRQTYIRPIK